MHTLCRTLNLGIVAHVDAGKTSLTERLLHAAGVIDQLGSVDDGNTQTDTLALERQRGITIRAAVVSFELNGATVNLVDTPGHSDFIAEVERSLAVLDGAVLVISAVEGVQAQTRVLMRVLTRMGIPTLLYVNKIDRAGAREEGLLRDIRERLTDNAIPLGTVADPGTNSAAYLAFGDDDERHRARLVELLVNRDDDLLRDWVDDPARVSTKRLRRTLARQSRAGLVHPLLFGSAITGAGLDEVARAITTYLPVRQPDTTAPLSGSVFKIDRGPSGEKIALVRVATGHLGVRERVRFGDVEDRVTAIRVHDGGGLVRATSVTAGHMAQVIGLESARVGDQIGVSIADPSGLRAGTPTGVPQFAPPTLETVVEPVDRSERGRLHTALTRLAESDPLINLRQDDVRGETHLSLYGEVQKEVIAATLETDFGVRVRFRETTVICVERVVGEGAAFEIIDVAPNAYLATVGLRVAPGLPGSGVEFRLDVELGSMPLAFFRAVEDTVHETLTQGLQGWPVLDCVVSMTHSGYYPRQSHAHQGFSKAMSSTASDFRGLTPLVLMEALRRAGTTVEEPMHRFDFDLPASVLGSALALLSHVRAVPSTTEVRGQVAHLGGVVPAANVHELQQRVPGLTGGEGDLVCEFEGYQAVSGEVPVRARTGPDPLNRRTWLLEVRR